MTPHEAARAMKVLLGDTRSPAFLEVIREHGWGRMCVRDHPKPYPGEPWGFDNGAYTAWTRGESFPSDTFKRRLDVALRRVEQGAPAPYMAVVPDVVAGGVHSLEFSLSWVDALPRGWAWYLAVQDGMTPADVQQEIGAFQGIFLGGTTRFKSTARAWRELAHGFGLKFHYGRAGTSWRVEHAISVGADSLDSAFPLWTQARFREFVADLQAPRSPSLDAVRAWMATAGMYESDPLTGCAP